MKHNLIVLLFLLFFSSGIFAQNPCKPPEIVFNRDNQNIFSEEQEMYLGEVMAETLEKNFRAIDDDEANRYIRQIGEKLVKHLPPTNIKFQFRVVDVPDVNAFALAGGRIYVTRKLIAFVKSEDELAGIIGHELGHGIVRHHALDLSKFFKQILGVERVGDRDDVFRKFNEFLDKQNTKRVKVKRSHEGDQQLEADRIGLFAMVAAGYKPEAFTSAWERLTETKGRTGNAFTDFFGTTRPEEKRLREMLKAISTISPDCLDKKSVAANDKFAQWQSYVVTTTAFSKTEKLKGLTAKSSLNPFLRGDIRHLQFSPDGKYIIAQDVSGINVLSREPFKFLFRINAEDAKFASFSPDSQFVTFQTYGLRVEKWSVAEQKAVSAREVYTLGDCWQSALSPDGNTLVCYSNRTNLDIINVNNNELLYRKEKFYIPSFMEYIGWSFSMSENDEKETDALQMEFSPNGSYFLAGRVFRFSTGGSASVGGFTYMTWGMDLDQDSFIAYDFRQRKEIKLSGELKSIVSMPFAFYSEDRIIGQHRKDMDKSGIFTFPEGARVEKFFMNADSYTKTYKNDYILVRPTTTNPVGVYDVPNKKFVAGNKNSALDLYDDILVSEGRDGIIDLVKFDKTNKKAVPLGELVLPKNDLGDVRTVSLSPDFQWLALSEKSRGAVWNTKTGEMKIYIRGFRGSYFDEDGSVIADFPAFEKDKRTMGAMNPATMTMERLNPVETGKTKQSGKFLVRMKSKDDEKLEKKLAKQKDKNAPQTNPADEEEEKKARLKFTFSDGFLTGINLRDGLPLEQGTLEVYQSRSKNLLWSREFASEIPRYDFDPTSETVAFYWRVDTKAAKEEMKKTPALQQKLSALGNKNGDYLVQILDANTGNVIAQNLIETGEGSFSIKRVFAGGDYLTIIDSENRVQIYSLNSGELKWRFFGENAVLNPAKSLAVVENMPGQLSVYNLDTGKKINELLFSSPVTFSQFSKDGKKLFVLAANQNYYLFDSDKLTV